MITRLSYKLNTRVPPPRIGFENGYFIGFNRLVFRAFYSCLTGQPTRHRPNQAGTKTIRNALFLLRPHIKSRSDQPHNYSNQRGGIAEKVQEKCRLDDVEYHQEWEHDPQYRQEKADQ